MDLKKPLSSNFSSEDSSTELQSSFSQENPNFLEDSLNKTDSDENSILELKGESDPLVSKNLLTNSFSEGAGTVFVLKVFDSKQKCEGRLLFDNQERMDLFLELVSCSKNKVGFYEQEGIFEVDSFLYSKVKSRKTFFVFNSFFDSSVLNKK